MGTDPCSLCCCAVCCVPWLKNVAGAVGKAQPACIPLFWHSRQREEGAAGGDSVGCVPVPLGFPGSSQPSMPAAHDLGAFWSSSCCLRVIHHPQPLMDSIQLLLPHPPSVIHVVAGSRFLLAARVPDILYLRIVFFPGSQFSPSLIPPFSFQLHPCSDGVVALVPSPTIPSPHAAEGGGAGCISCCGNGKGMLGGVGTAPSQLYLLRRGAKST